jgi:hypothetical protein
MASNRQNSSMLNNSQSSSSNSTNVTIVKDKTKSDSTKNKHGNKVIYKITSESVRIICEKSSTSSSSSSTSTTLNNDKKLLLLDKSSSSSGHVPMSSNSILNTMNNMSQKRKGTSFQITSVSVSKGNTNNDHHHQRSAENNGDESADDLDESQITDDNISRITDYETPSFSEDTFSREDVFFAQPNAFGTAPVIPTSSQYGLAIVGPADLGGNANLGDVHVSVTDAGINIMGQMPNKQDVDHKNERFKVVKIESTEPFKRGRWMCMDYLDHTLQTQDDGTDGSTVNSNAIKDNNTNSNVDSEDQQQQQQQNVVITKDSGLESGLDDNGIGDIIDNDGPDQEVMKAEMNHIEASHQHHQQQQQDNIMEQNGVAQTTTITRTNTISSQQQQQPQQNTTNNLGTFDNSSISMTHQQQQQHPHEHHHHAHSMTPDMIQRSLDPQLHHQQQQHFNQGATLPTNVLLQKIHPDQNLQQSLNSSNIQQQQTKIVSPIPPQQQIEEIKNENVTSQFQPQHVVTGDKLIESDQAAATTTITTSSTNENSVNVNNSDGSNNLNPGAPATQSPSSSAGSGIVTDGNEGQAGVPATGDDGQSMNEDSER